jgi:hypothetical protein
LTTIIAAGLGWYVARVRPHERAVESILDRGGWVAYGYFEMSSDALQNIVRRETYNAWRGLVGNVTVVNVGGGDSKQGDAICRQLAKLKAIREAYLQPMGITDAGLENFGCLKNLKTLALSDAMITDAGLRHLSGLPRLESLLLDNTGISDAGIEELAKLKTLKYLDISHTNVTEQRVKELQQALPECKIIWLRSPTGFYGRKAELLRIP